MSVSPINSVLPPVSSRERGAQAGAPPPAAGAPAPPTESEQVVALANQQAARVVVAADSGVRQAVEDANRKLREQSLNLQYSVDGDTKKMVIKLVDSSSGEIIRQIPSEEMLAIARALDRVLASGSGFAIQAEA